MVDETEDKNEGDRYFQEILGKYVIDFGTHGKWKTVQNSPVLQVVKVEVHGHPLRDAPQDYLVINDVSNKQILVKVCVVQPYHLRRAWRDIKRTQYEEEQTVGRTRKLHRRKRH